MALCLGSLSCWKMNLLPHLKWVLCFVANAIRGIIWTFLRNGLRRALELVEPYNFTPLSAKEHCRLLRMIVGILKASLTSQYLSLLLSFEGWPGPVLLRVWMLWWTFHFLMMEPVVLNSIFKLFNIFFIAISCLAHFNYCSSHLQNALFFLIFAVIFQQRQGVLFIFREKPYFRMYKLYLIMFNYGQITVTFVLFWLICP